MEKSFIVQGKGLEEALDKAAIILHCDKERIAYEIMQDAKPGHYGQRGVSCKLRVIPVSPSASELASAGGRDGDAAILDVAMPLSDDDLSFLPSPLLLKELGQAVVRDLAVRALPPVGGRPAPTRRIVQGSLALAEGPIDHDGDVRIQGDVRKGQRVKASGSIRVDGGVETAFLDAGEDILIAEGLLGTARSARGAVRCRFAQGARIEAPCGDVAISESAMHSQIHAGRVVTVGEILLGGFCYGEELVQVHIAGSESGIPTLLQAGQNRRLSEHIEQIREQARRDVGWLAESNAVQQELLPTEEGGKALPPADRLRLWRAVIRSSRLNAELRHLSLQKSTLLGMMGAERGSRVCVADRVYPRVKVMIDDTALEMQKVTQFVTFSKDYEIGELRLTPYH